MKLFKPEVEAEKFWNPYMQTMPRAELDRLHLKKLQTLIEYAYHRTPFYRALYDRHKVRPEQIRTMDDFVKRIPFIDKKDVVTAQGTAPPFGDALAISEDFFLQRFATSGSTGTPLHIPLTYYSTVLWGESWMPLFWGIGLRPRHSFYFPFHWGIFAAFWSAYLGIRRLGGSTARAASSRSWIIAPMPSSGPPPTCSTSLRWRGRWGWTSGRPRSPT
jgi:phenylacetate-CoA ligase